MLKNFNIFGVGMGSPIFATCQLSFEVSGEIHGFDLVERNRKCSDFVLGLLLFCILGLIILNTYRANEAHNPPIHLCVYPLLILHSHAHTHTYAFSHSFTHSLTPSHTHTLSHLLTHSVIHSLTHNHKGHRKSNCLNTLLYSHSRTNT